MNTAQKPKPIEAIIPFDIPNIRKNFPILEQEVHGKTLVYLDNAATTQKPQSVIEAVQRFYERDNANIHRGVHDLSERATKAYEAARVKVQNFLGAHSPQEIIFTRGTTESINLVAQSFGRDQVKAGDEILITHMEHHSNIVPWQMLCEQTGAKLKVAPINDQGELIVEDFERLLSHQTKLVALVHISNSLGTINPVKQLIQLAHEHQVPVLIDGAQAVAHMQLNMHELDADFYAFSGHKLFGPTGIGVLYGKQGLLEMMPPYQGGGDMIRQVSFEKTTYNDLPYKFEAGTPHIAGAIGLGAAIDYVQAIGYENIAKYEHELLNYATEQLQKFSGVRIIGTAENKVSVISFVLEGVHPHDIGTILDEEGIAVRAGHHCTMPLMERFKVPATVRASFSFYNTKAEVDALIQALGKVKELFKIP